MSVNYYLPPSPVIPMFLIITSITNSARAVVTVGTENNYIPGQLVYFSVPRDYGMFQINGLTGQIASVNTTNLIFIIDINTTQFDTFSLPSGSQEKPASISPAGSRNLYNIATVPFHSEGNFGN